MRQQILKRAGNLLRFLVVGLILTLPWTQLQASHNIRGITGGTAAGAATFNLYAFPFNMNLPDGSSVYMWGFGDMDSGANATHPEGNGYGLPQYPAPTLIVNQGDVVTINLTNVGLTQPVSIVVSGHRVSATEIVPGDGNDGGIVTEEASLNEKVSYTFTASEAGTYVYHSLAGPNPGLQAEMGLQGVLIVRPTGYDPVTNRKAYGAAQTEYDQEVLILITELDPELHFEMERGHYNHVTHADRAATIWFVNGRVFPDLFQPDYTGSLQHQPYQALAQTHPGDKVLIREVNAGHDSHPFHHHGENMRLIARDGRVLSSDNGVTADLGRYDNTLNMAPKQTIDSIWTWSGKDLNWDIYGPVNTACTDTNNNMADDASEGGAPEDLVMCHDATCTDVSPADGFDDVNHEYCGDHTKEFPVTLPGVQDLTLGGWWSGSPFLGDAGDLPPGEGGLNPFSGYFLMWHSHNEKELTTFDIFPGGSLSAVVVLPPYMAIE